jgi:hypothetical protein
VVGLSPEDRTQKRKIKSEEIHRKIKSKWTNRKIARRADQNNQEVENKTLKAAKDRNSHGSDTKGGGGGSAVNIIKIS